MCDLEISGEGSGWPGAQGSWAEFGGSILSPKAAGKQVTRAQLEPLNSVGSVGLFHFALGVRKAASPLKVQEIGAFTLVRCPWKKTHRIPAFNMAHGKRFLKRWINMFEYLQNTPRHGGLAKSLLPTLCHVLQAACFDYPFSLSGHAFGF